MRVAVAEEVGEARLVLGPFEFVAAGFAAGELVGIGLGRRHCLAVDVAVFVRGRLRVVLDAERVSWLTAIDTKFAIGAGEVDGLGAFAHLNVVWFRGTLGYYSSKYLVNEGIVDLLSNTWADRVSPSKMQFLR